MSGPSDVAAQWGVPPGVAVRRCTHEAMACTWEMFLLCDDAAYAAHAARAACAEIDRLESELSRFVPTSDVSRLNVAPVGQAVLLGADALEVLLLAARVHDATDGAFDITVGGLVPRQQQTTENSNNSARAEPVWSAAGMRALAIDRAARTATRLASELVVDLGAIGKGFAVDAAVGVLREWKIAAGIVHSGQSTAYALGAPPEREGWRLALRNPANHAEILDYVTLRDAALSGSGVVLHGRHIIDPRTGRPANGPDAAWAIAPSGALSDAISTALMVLTPGDMAQCVSAFPGIGGFVYQWSAENRAGGSAGKIVRVV